MTEEQMQIARLTKELGDARAKLEDWRSAAKEAIDALARPMETDYSTTLSEVIEQMLEVQRRTGLPKLPGND